MLGGTSLHGESCTNLHGWGNAPLSSRSTLHLSLPTQRNRSLRPDESAYRESEAFQNFTGSGRLNLVAGTVFSCSLFSVFPSAWEFGLSTFQGAVVASLACPNGRKMPCDSILATGELVS
jgi:hypothetical protein